MGVPEGKIPFAFTRQHVGGKQLPLKGGGILFGQLRVEALDDLFYTRELLRFIQKQNQPFNLVTAFKWL